jgi:hypothetical protein
LSHWPFTISIFRFPFDHLAACPPSMGSDRIKDRALKTSARLRGVMASVPDGPDGSNGVHGQLQMVDGQLPNGQMAKWQMAKWPNGPMEMANGKWQMANGQWQVKKP